jgi:hypothetical protein
MLAKNTRGELGKNLFAALQRSSEQRRQEVFASSSYRTAGHLSRSSSSLSSLTPALLTKFLENA